MLMNQYTWNRASKRIPRQWRRHRRCWFHPWVRKILWRKEWLPTPVFQPGEFHGQRNLAGYSRCVHKESDTTEWLSMHAHCASGKESTCQEMRDSGLIPGPGRFHGVGNGNSLQYSCLENPMDRGVWQATVSSWGCKESDMTEHTHNMHEIRYF